jgi:hypothetical protein
MSKWTMVAKDRDGRLLASLRPGTTKETGDSAELNWEGIAIETGVPAYFELTRNGTLLPRAVAYFTGGGVTIGDTVTGFVTLSGLTWPVGETDAEPGSRRCTCGTQGQGVCSSWCDLVRTLP